MVVPQQLYTFYSNGDGYPYNETPSTDGGTYYSMFPLAYKTIGAGYQNFCIEDYLPVQNQRVATLIGTNQSYFWWLRSGALGTYLRAHYVKPMGDIVADSVTHTNGVRPAFVLKIVE